MRDYYDRGSTPTCGGCAYRFAVVTRLGEVGVCVRDAHMAEDVDELRALHGELPLVDDGDAACEDWEEADGWA